MFTFGLYNIKKLFLRYFRREFAVRTALCALGVLFIGIGVGALRFADFGLDPFMCLVNGVYAVVFKPLGIGFGTAYLVFCFTLLLGVLIFDRSKIGAGTVINMTIPGYVSDLVLRPLNSVPAEGAGLFILRAAGMCLGILCICAGSGLYFNTRIGNSPYDAAGLAIAEKTGKEKWYRWIRIGTDMVCSAAGFVLGSVPGVGTIIMAFFTGPLFAFFRYRFLVWGKRAKIITWD